MNKHKFLSVSLLISLVVAACNTNRNLSANTRNGSYLSQVTSTSRKTKPIIFGEILEYESNVPIPFSAVQINNKEFFKGDTNGRFMFEVQPGKYNFTGKGMPYEFVRTKKILLNQGDSLKLIFKLKPYTKPLVD